MKTTLRVLAVLPFFLLACIAPPPVDSGTAEQDAGNVVPPDAALPDSATAADTWQPDIATSDTWRPDSWAPDLSSPDTASPDIVTTDTGSTDAGSVDTATPDAWRPDTATADSGPAGWTCYDEWYGTADGCDCGCGILDPDCAGPAYTDCEYNGCPGWDIGVEIDPDSPTQCVGEDVPDHPMVNRDELTRIVSYLASDELQGREEGSPGGQAARAFIVDELEACGVTPAGEDGYLQTITAGNGTNVLGWIQGADAELAPRTVLLSAHYDHLGVAEGGEVFNGASDNAACVATVLRIACDLAANPPAKSVLIALWDAEEPQTFLTDAMGSEFYAAHPTRPLAELDVAIVLDVFGAQLWPGYLGHFVFGAELSREVAQVINGVAPPALLPARRGGLHLFEERPDGQLALSDYDAFRNRGVPVLFFSDGQNQLYHTTNDEVAYMSRSKMTLEALYVLDVVKAFVANTNTPAFDSAGADYAVDAAIMVAVLTDALAADVGLVDTLELSSGSRGALEGDLAAVTAVQTKVARGESPTGAEIAALRRGAQRVLCFSIYGAGLFNEYACQSL